MEEDRRDKKRNRDRSHSKEPKEISRNSKDSKSRRSTSKDRQRGRSRDQEKDRYYRSISPENRGTKFDREHEISKESKTREKERDRGRSRDKGKEKDRGRSRDKEIDRNRDREKEKDREREREREKDRVKEKDREREREREREKENDRERPRESGRDREREKYREQEKNRDRGRDGEREKERHRKDEDNQDEPKKTTTQKKEDKRSDKLKKIREMMRKFNGFSEESQEESTTNSNQAGESEAEPSAEMTLEEAPSSIFEQQVEDADPLDQFMASLYGAGDIAEQHEAQVKREVGGKAQSQEEEEEGLEDLFSLSKNTNKQKKTKSFEKDSTSDPDEPARGPNPFGSNFVTLDEILRASSTPMGLGSGWESDLGDPLATPSQSKKHRGSSAEDETEDEMVSESEEKGPSKSGNEEEDEEARWERERMEFMEAFRKAREEEELKEKNKEMRINLAQTLMTSEPEAEIPVEKGKASKKDDLGVMFASEGDVVDEAEREAKRRSALDLLDEARKGKELKAVDHSQISYIPIRKNLFIVPKVLAQLSQDEIRSRRDAMQIQVRGRGCPAPVDSWEQCGLSDRILQTLEKLNITTPFPIQKQAIPAAMCGRDLIGVAKTGSGKTLAFLLPLVRHILDQPPLRDGEGPIGLILAPSRELALQIASEGKKIGKSLGLRVACVYGGAGVAEQIADLKRGAEIVVATPGRLIDILNMQAGKMVSMKRISMLILDEADRMFDMGFEPQIKMISQNIRPDRQTLLFSATFPKQIESLAKRMLRLPLEIIIGERATINKDIAQIVEVHEEEDKFLRLLQLLGVWNDKGSVLIFVDKQDTCDQLFQDLLKSGYPCLSLHGGKDQMDRDYTLHEFKTGIKTVMVATSVAGRGLDVPDIVCVINYNCPNHLEDYVHRVGRTGRAGRKGTAYTFISSKEEQYSPIMVKALQRAGTEIPKELSDMVQIFKFKVERGEAYEVRGCSGFHGSGFKFDPSELNETQKAAASQRKAYNIEEGLADDEDEAEPYDEDEDFEFSEQSASERTLALFDSAPPVPPVASSMDPSLASTLHPDVLKSIEKLKAQAALNTGKSLSSSSAPPDPRAALEKARLVAELIGSKSMELLVGNQTGYFKEELEINDYPVQARRKVTSRDVLDDVIDRTGVAIISRGVYIPPEKKKIDPGERKLFLLIEGTSERSVSLAKTQLRHVLEEETIRLGASGMLTGGAAGGRYSVI